MDLCAGCGPVVLTCVVNPQRSILSHEKPHKHTLLRLGGSLSYVRKQAYC